MKTRTLSLFALAAVLAVGALVWSRYRESSRKDADRAQLELAKAAPAQDLVVQTKVAGDRVVAHVPLGGRPLDREPTLADFARKMDVLPPGLASVAGDDPPPQRPADMSEQEWAKVQARYEAERNDPERFIAHQNFKEERRAQRRAGDTGERNGPRPQLHAAPRPAGTGGPEAAAVETP